MHLPGSRQVGLGKRLLEQYTWQQFQPHPEWAAFVGESDLAFEGSRWLWYPEGNPAQDAPVAKRHFRRAFVLPEGKTVAQARLRVSADDWFSARLNGQMLGTGEDWRVGKQFEIARLLRPGTNVLAIVAENKSAPVTANPAGLIACLEVRFAENEQVVKLVSDDTWRCARDGADGDHELVLRAERVDPGGELVVQDLDREPATADPGVGELLREGLRPPGP